MGFVKDNSYTALHVTYRTTPPSHREFFTSTTTIISKKELIVRVCYEQCRQLTKTNEVAGQGYYIKHKKRPNTFQDNFSD